MRCSVVFFKELEVWQNFCSRSGRRFLTASFLATSLIVTGCGEGELDSQTITVSGGELDGETFTISRGDSSDSEGDLGAANPTDQSTTDTVEEAIVTDSTGDTDNPVLIADRLVPTVYDIDASSAKVTWDAGEPVTGVVKYGLTENLGTETPQEASFIYSAHIQNLRNLESDTKYYYSVESMTESGQTLNSPVMSFVTAASTDSSSQDSSVSVSESDVQQGTSPDWPQDANELLPMGGVFYGNFQQGMQTGNAGIAKHNARRFRAERSGYIDAITYPNRVLEEGNISGRCLPSNPDSVWCKCVNAGLDRFSCGYTLSNSYSVGNGGSYRIQIRENDESTGEPSDVILGEIATQFVPQNNSGVYRPELELAEKVYLQAGKIYHMVHWNEAYPINCRIARIPVEDAASCDRNRGAVGLNGIQLPTTLGLDGGLDPFRGTTGKNFIKYSDTQAWIPDDDNISFYEVRYDDGTWVGESYAAHGGTLVGDGVKAIGGNIVARQAMTVRDATRTVNGLWLYFGHDPSKTPDGSPISLALKDSEGQTLATGEIAYSPECAERTRSGNSSGNRPDKFCRYWGYTDLSSEVALIEGDTYYAEFRAKASGAFHFTTFFPIDYGGYISTSHNQWNDAQAEVSTNGGSTWELWLGQRWPKRDFPMLFTQKGMPKRLP